MHYDLEGYLGTFTLVDIIQFLTFSNKSGTLTLHHEQHSYSLTFEHGKITYVAATTRMHRMGELLVESGKITRDDLELALENQAHDADPLPLGQILLEMQLVQPEDLQACIDQQLEETIYKLFLLHNCRYTFKAGPLSKFGGRAVDLVGERIIMDAIRRIDEWNHVHTVVSSVRMVFQRTNDNPEAILQFILQQKQVSEQPEVPGDDDWGDETDLFEVEQPDDEITASDIRVYYALDGNRDIVQVAQESGLTQLAVAQSVYKLSHAGLVQAVLPEKVYAVV